MNGVFGDGNDVAAHFDVGKYGIRNCEGIGSDPQRRTLLVIDDYERKIFELSRSGRLLRTITIPLSDPDLWLAGVTVAPTSNPNDGPSAMSYWIVDRHVDNNANPKENDGRIYEVLVPSLTFSLHPAKGDARMWRNGHAAGSAFGVPVLFP